MYLWFWNKVCRSGHREVRVRLPFLVVGGSGLEPLTSCVSSKYSNQLS